MGVWAKVGSVVTDSASLWLGDPAFPPDPERTAEDACGSTRFCDEKEADRWGFWFLTPHGDGEYPVYAQFTAGGEVRRLMVDLDPEGER